MNKFLIFLAVILLISGTSFSRCAHIVKDELIVSGESLDLIAPVRIKSTDPHNFKCLNVQGHDVVFKNRTEIFCFKETSDFEQLCFGHTNATAICFDPSRVVLDAAPSAGMAVIAHFDTLQVQSNWPGNVPCEALEVPLSLIDASSGVDIEEVQINYNYGTASCVTAAVNEEDGVSKVSVCPNAASNFVLFAIDLIESFRFEDISIIDRFGRKELSRVLSGSENNLEIKFKSLKEGAYFLLTPC
jgi:hypothetical protein